MLREKTAALGTKLTPCARWVLGFGFFLWLAVGLYKLWIGDRRSAAILLAWAAWHETSWAIFDRKRIFALIFGVLASSLYFQVAAVKVHAWGDGAPLYLRVIELGCGALVFVYLFACVAEIRSIVERRDSRKVLNWTFWRGVLHPRNYPAWLLGLGFVQSDKWGGLSITAGILGATFWIFLQWNLDFPAAPNTPALTIGIVVARVFLAQLFVIPLYFAVPWTAVQVVGWMVQRLSLQRSLG